MNLKKTELESAKKLTSKGHFNFRFKTINTFTIKFLFLILTWSVLFNSADPILRFRRQSFDPVAVSSSSSDSNGSGSSFGPFGIPWFGPMPFHLPLMNIPAPPNHDQLRQKVNDYISDATKQIQYQPLADHISQQSANCTTSKNETVDVNGMKINKITKTCTSNGSNSIITSVSSSSVPV
ncbi:uncharacterized protein LOC128388613 [Panonychus citri]|uniref:uncharacterized protein LOC128388613 n=1 Tax=Panonychus citri TaxID=50023 RepID=UPI0023074A16|nr:uncharacterized protein LOC128388613 [Panonychus citri]